MLLEMEHWDLCPRPPLAPIAANFAGRLPVSLSLAPPDRHAKNTSAMSDIDSETGEEQELDLSNVRKRRRMVTITSRRARLTPLAPCSQMSSPSTRLPPRSATVSDTRNCFILLPCAMREALLTWCRRPRHRRGHRCRDRRVQGWREDCGPVRPRRLHHQQVRPAPQTALLLPTEVDGFPDLRSGTNRREVAGIFKNKNMEKGLAFPTCVSVNK